VRQIQLAGAMFEHLDQARFVEYRVGVRRAGQTGDAAGSGCQHFAFQRGLVLIARFAQSGRNVDQSRADHQAGGVDHLIGSEVRWRLADADHLACRDKQILFGVDAILRVDQPAVFDLNLHQLLPARMDITAMRTAIP